MEAGFNWLHHIPAEQAALFLLDVCDITLVCGRMFDVHRRHANLPAFGGILPLSGRIPAIPRGIDEIPLFKTILCVTESSKVAHLLSLNGLSSSKCAKTCGQPGLWPRTPLGQLTTFPPDRLVSWLVSRPVTIPHLRQCVWHLELGQSLEYLAPRTDPSFSFREVGMSDIEI